MMKAAKLWVMLLFTAKTLNQPHSTEVGFVEGKTDFS